jgi:TolB-like protein/Tfp pilus assembly protein PilF
LLHAIDAIVDRPTGPQVPPPLSRIDAGRRRLVLPGLGLAVLAATGGGWWVRRRAGVLPSISNSVAVLPFRNMGDDRSQSFFSDGLSEELRTALSRVHDLQVAARTSSNVFREQQESAQSIGAKLGVAFLLEGSVRRAQDVVRIAVSLIDTATGFNRWSQSFDRTLRDIFAVQSEIADAVATTIVAQIATAQPRLGSTTNVQAFEAYLRGRALYHQDSGEETDRAALELFDEAIAADPLYAAAHAIRSRSLLAIASAYSAAAALPALHDEAEGAARRATELAPDLADGHWAMADLLFEGRLQVQAARQPYDSAHRVGAGDADFLSAFAFYCAQTGRDSDAITEIRRALVLDPLNARAYRMTGWVHYTARRYSDCIAPLRHALAMNDKLTYAYASIGDALLQLGRPQEARDAYGREPAPQPGLTGIAIAERKLGNDGAAQAALDRLIAEQGDSALYQQAQVRAQWQDTDGAIACLLHARQVGDAGLVYLHRDPFLDPVRADARFKQLERALGFV